MFYVWKFILNDEYWYKDAQHGIDDDDVDEEEEFMDQGANEEVEYDGERNIQDAVFQDTFKRVSVKHGVPQWGPQWGTFWGSIEFYRPE